MSREVNVLALVKGEEHYVFIYEDDAHESLYNTLRNWAADPQLSINWFDVSVLIEKARQQLPQETTPDRLETMSRRWER